MDLATKSFLKGNNYVTFYEDYATFFIQKTSFFEYIQCNIVPSSTDLIFPILPVIYKIQNK